MRSRRAYDMKADELKEILRQRGVSCEEKTIQDGLQLRCEQGEIFSVYKTGKVVVGGAKTELSEFVRSLGSGSRSAKPQAVPAETKEATTDEIFVVYGHDTDARDQLELMLRRMGMTPIILSNLAAAGDTIIEKLESYIGQHGKAAYACVLVTPDDEGYKVGEFDKKKYRARQNVVLELGMVLARLGRKRVAILRKKTVEQPSDIDGLIYIPFDEKVEEIKLQLTKELQAAGFSPRL
jgi:predicted nucleotide-binding protein